MMLTLTNQVCVEAVRHGIPQHLLESAAMWFDHVEALQADFRYILKADPNLPSRMTAHGCSEYEIDNLDGVCLVVDRDGCILALFDDQPACTLEGCGFVSRMNMILEQRVGN